MSGLQGDAQGAGGRWIRRACRRMSAARFRNRTLTRYEGRWGVSSGVCVTWRCGWALRIQYRVAICPKTKTEAGNAVMEKYQTQIQHEAIARGVKHLYHFTPLDNLPGIAAHGLLCRRTLHEPAYTAYAVDENRWDGRDDVISVSIEGFDERLLKKRLAKSHHDGWVLLVLSPRILWELPCEFCWSNASRKDIRNYRGFRGGPGPSPKCSPEPTNGERGSRHASPPTRRQKFTCAMLSRATISTDSSCMARRLLPVCDPCSPHWT